MKAEAKGTAVPRTGLAVPHNVAETMIAVYQNGATLKEAVTPFGYHCSVLAQTLGARFHRSRPATSYSRSTAKIYRPRSRSGVWMN